MDGKRAEAKGVRRVVVGLDESEGSREALEEAARLAAALRVELVGLFIEDVTFLQAAALPVTRALSMSAREPLDMAPDMMERAFRIHGERLRDIFVKASARWGLHASFRTLRGEIAEQIQAILDEGDLVALGRTGRRRANHQVIGSTALAMIECARCPVLLFAGPLRTDAPVLAVYEGSRRVLELAAEIARCYGLGLRVVVLGDGDQEALRKDITSWCDEQNVAVTVVMAEGHVDEQVFEALSKQMAAVAIVDANGVVVRRLGLRALLPRISGPVLVVR